MSLDLEYLLWLQNFRALTSDVLTPFMEWVSVFSTGFLLFIPAFIYWCIDKRKGLLIFLAWKISMVINSLIKLTCCIYRPWVRDAKIIPAGNAIKTAGGYSFPSGHTMTAAPIYGSVALLIKNKLIKALLILAILLLAFSRNYLGVHTPQDVLVGFILGLLAVYITNKILNYLDKDFNSNSKLEDLFIALLFLSGIATLIYISFKSYPLDYNQDGKLLVDPVKMQIDAWQDAGGIIPLALCWWLDRKFIKFKATGLNLKSVILNLIGMIPLYFILDKTLRNYLVLGCGAYWGRLLNQSALFIYIIIIWPLILKLFKLNKNI